jgi:hypothetical protein
VAEAGPWEKFQFSDDSGPWSKFAAPTPEEPKPLDFKAKLKVSAPYVVDPKTGGYVPNPEFRGYGANLAEGAKGFLSGLGQMVTGAGELVPGTIGDKSAEATRRLEAIGDPDQQIAAKIGIAFVPLAGATEALQGGNAIRAILQGAGTGAAVGALQPTGEESAAARYATKAEEAGLGALTGAAVPAAAEGVRLGLQVPKFIRAAGGKVAEKAAEDLRSDVSSEARAASEAEAAKSGEKAIEVSGRLEEVSKHDQDLARLERAQQNLASRSRDRAEGAVVGRDPLTGRPIVGSRDAAQAIDPAADAEIRARVSARMRQRVSDAERDARKAGMSEDEARSFAVEQERAETSASEAADRIVQEQASRPIETPEALGKRIHDAALADMRALKETRLKESGFAEAIAADGGKPSVQTAMFAPKIAKMAQDTKVPEFRASLNWLRSALSSPGAEGKPVSAASIKQAREIIEEMNRRIEGLPNGPAHEMTALRDELLDHLETTHPQLRAARRKYAELSRPLDVYERTGALSKAVKTDPYNDTSVVDPSRIVGAVLNKTEGGADALGRLVQNDPELKDAARRYFNYQLFGSPGAQRTPSLAQFNNFIRDNRMALDRAGLSQEFADLKSAREAGQAAIDRAKAAVGGAKEAVKTAEDARREALNRVSSERRLSQRAARREEEVASGKTSVSPEEIGKSAERRAKEAAARLTEQSRRVSSEASEARKGLESVEREREAAAEAHAEYQRLLIEVDAGNLDARGVVAKGREIAKKLVKEGRIENARYDEFLKQIKDVEEKFKDKDEAVRQVGKALGYLAGAGIGASGASYLIRRRIF